MLFYLVLVLIFIAGFLVVSFILLLLSKRANSVKKRLLNVESISGNLNLEQELLAKKVTFRKKLDTKIKKGFLTLVQFTVKNEQTDSRLRNSLIQAGFYQENSVRIFLGLKMFCAIIIFIAYSIFGYNILGYLGRGNGLSIFLMGVAVSLMGYLLPNFLLRGKIRRRQDEIASGLPDALDFLVICVEAGLGLNAALMRVGKELQLRCKALGEELLIANQEMRTGISREKSLRNLSERNLIRDLKVLTASIILSDRLGTNLADTLRAQADSLRTRVRQRAEERAAKAGLKMLFPLVFFIMPALYIAILGPGIIMVVKTLMPVLPQ